MPRKTQLTYDSSTDQWGVTIKNRWYGVGCGECFGLRIGKSFIGCRLEIDSNWYVILPDDTRFILHPRTSYMVSIDA